MIYGSVRDLNSLKLYYELVQKTLLPNASFRNIL
jgi:hypothetical protein